MPPVLLYFLQQRRDLVPRSRGQHAHHAAQQHPQGSAEEEAVAGEREDQYVGHHQVVAEKGSDEEKDVDSNLLPEWITRSIARGIVRCTCAFGGGILRRVASRGGNGFSDEKAPPSLGLQQQVAAEQEENEAAQ